jgi:hypothetical protein
MRPHPIECGPDATGQRDPDLVAEDGPGLVPERGPHDDHGRLRRIERRSGTVVET